MKTLTLLFAFIVFGTAGDQPSSPAAGEGAAKLQQIAERLQLTDEQKAEIAPILEQEWADLKALREDTSLRRMQRARRAKEITDTASKQIRAILTPEQQPEYDALRAEMRDKLKAKAKERQRAEN
jgi:Spy/CpxP family protein refolding chaperone